MLILMVLGLIVGSFLGVLTWRIPRKLDFVKGRSKCPHCNSIIEARDNIPLISFIFLKGRCRNCKKKISIREPLIELCTAFLFVLTPVLPLPFPVVISLIIVSILIVIFVIDLEHKLIYDEFVYVGLGIVLMFLLLTNSPDLYIHLLVGFAGSLFLLAIALVTYGKGMGLGDVKLAIFLGVMFSPKEGLFWLLLSFLTGAAVGVILIISKRAKLKSEVPFGPFLIIGFVLALLMVNTDIFLKFF